MNTVSAGANLRAKVVQTFPLPTVSSQNMMIATVELSAHSATESVEATELLQFNIKTSGSTGAHNEFHLVDLGNPVVGGAAGNYNVGTWEDNNPANGGTLCGCEFYDTGVSVPAPSAPGGDSHVITTELFNTGSGISRQSYLSINGGAK